MKKIYKSKTGITLITLVVAVSIMIIISSLLIYNARTGIKVRNYRMMQNDIELLNDKVEAYYVKYSALPISIKYNVSTLPFESMLNPNDSSDGYYVLDLKAFEGLTLNYGVDFDKVTEATVADFNDIYIINEQSHQIYYARGIELDGIIYYTNEIAEEIDLIPIEKENTWKIYVLDDNGNQVFGKTLIRIYKDEELTDMVKQVVIRNGYYDGSSNILDIGNYYIEIITTPTYPIEYSAPKDGLIFKINNKKIGIWKINLDISNSLDTFKGYFEFKQNPSYYEGEAIEWGKNVEIEVTDVAPIIKDVYFEINVYKIGYYDINKEEYFYTDDFKNIEDSMELIEVANIMKDCYEYNATEEQIKQINNWNDDLYDYIFQNSIDQYAISENGQKIELERNGIYLFVMGNIEEISCISNDMYEYYTGEYLFFAPLLNWQGVYDSKEPTLKNASLCINTTILNYNPIIGEQTIIYRVDNYIDETKEELYLSKIIVQKFDEFSSENSITLGRLFPRIYRSNDAL